MNNLQKTWFRISIAVGILVLLIAVLLSGIYFYNYTRDAAPEIVGEITVTPTSVELGRPVSGAAEIKLPWHMSIASAIVTPGQGSVVVNSPRIVKAKNSLGYNTYEVQFTIKSFSLGMIPAGQLVVELQNNRTETTQLDAFTLNIPPFESVRGTTTTDELQLAGHLNEPPLPNHNWLWGVLIMLGVVILGIVAILIVRHHQTLAQTTPELPWDRARRRLNQLRSLIRSAANNQELYNGFAELSDIIREYLEERFSLPATRQTTDEFMATLGNYRLPLSVVQRQNLRDFLNSADLVKFAKAAPDPVLLENAVNKADELVVSTEPAENEAIEQKEEHHD